MGSLAPDGGMPSAKFDLGRRSLMITASICAASILPSAARGQDVVTIAPPGLGMTGWRTDAITADTAPLRMTGWRTEPDVVDTAALGMTGWRADAITVDTAPLGMTGWRGGPVRSQALRTPALPDPQDAVRTCPANTVQWGRVCVRPSPAAAKSRLRAPRRNGTDSRR